MSTERVQQVCSRGIWNESVPGIRFDDAGVSNYARMYDSLCTAFPRGEQGRNDWNHLVEKIKTGGKNRRYDCIIGVSGGTDSSYLLHLAKNQYGLRPLAVNLDNGWNSDIAVQNIRKVTTALNIDLETYVINYEEIKDLMATYMKAGLPWIDNPTDLAIQSVLFRIAAKEKVTYILAGNDFRSEGKQPTEWTYSDQKQLRYLHKKLGSVKLKTYPMITLYQYLYLSFFRKIRLYYPYHYIDYNKQDAQSVIKKEYDWTYYGEHHYENIFTRWAIGYWMYEKFGIDKRLITYSAQVLSGVIDRQRALEIVGRKPYAPADAEKDTGYVIKKLGLTDQEFDRIWRAPNKTFLDYPSYYRWIQRCRPILGWFLATFFNMRPKIFLEMKERQSRLA